MSEERRPYLPWFDGHELPVSPSDMETIATHAHLMLEHREKENGRKRAPRASVRERTRLQIASLLASASREYLTKGEGGWLRIMQDQSKLTKLGQGRYCPTTFHRSLPATLKALEANQWVDVQPGEYNLGLCTEYRAGPELIRLLMQRQVCLSEIARDPDEEIVILKGEKERSDSAADWINYEDTDTTNEYRADLREINDWIEEQEISFEGDLPGLDTGRVRMRRYFNNCSLHSGGRMFGAFWQDLKSTHRPNLRINGEAIADLDFHAMNPRLIYALSGMDLPEFDPYTVPGLEQHRAATKIFFNAMLNKAERPTRMPLGFRKEFPEFPRSVTSEDLLAYFEDVHKPILKHLYPGPGRDPIGFRLAFMESSIMTVILLELKDRGVVALNMHDGVMVPESQADLAADVMTEVFQEWVSRQALVTRKA